MKKADDSQQLQLRSNALIGAQGEDFSGLDFDEARLNGQNFFESIFNGCDFKNIRVAQSIFQHAEFTESKFQKCTFEDTSFDHSDFVLSDISNCKFLRCSFQNAEWRDAAFTDVVFRQCIFRNTTTSLSHFRRCSFDSASAASFAGKSKRFSLFSETNFDLPKGELEFLRTNYGLIGHETADTFVESGDPFFDLSYLRFTNRFTSREFDDLFVECLGAVTNRGISANRLRLKYLCEICKLCIEENLVSVFGMQLLERRLSEEAHVISDRSHLLEIFGLIVTINAAINERISEIDRESSDLKQIGPSSLRINIAFERNYDRESVQQYARQLADYCGIGGEKIRIDNFRTGSTLADFLITAPALVLDVFRFLRYSLPLATVSLIQAKKLKAAVTDLSKPAVATKTVRRSRSRKKASGASKRELSLSKNSVTGAVLSEEAAQIQIHVDAVKEQVLLVDGKVRITISLA